MKNAIVTMFILFSAMGLYGQNNNVYVNAGTFGLTHSVNLNYEFGLAKNQGNQRYYLRTSAGTFKSRFELGGENPLEYTASLQAVGLFGKGNHFFEANLGVMTFFEKNEYSQNHERTSFYFPAGGIGYRYESKSWLFRTGVHFPDGAYVGVGLRF